jgi:hypothetical protein
MIRGAEAPVLIVTCPSRQVLTLTMGVPRPHGSPVARRLVFIRFDNGKFYEKFPLRQTHIETLCWFCWSVIFKDAAIW